jgi:hypothetical protein
METREHWDTVYRSKKSDAVSWYAPHLAESLHLIEQFCPDKTAAIVDIGGGESTLVDDLLQKGYLDISQAAIALIRQNWRPRADGNIWTAGSSQMQWLGCCPL